MTDVFHSVYGLRVRASCAIPGLAVDREPLRVDLEVHLQEGTPAAREGAGDSTDERGEPAWRRMADGGYRIRYADGTDFLIDAAGGHVWARWEHPMTLEDTATYLLGPILRQVLGLRGVVCLHGSAVVIDGCAVALVGPAGSGKSTTAAAFAVRGIPVLSDDLVALSPCDDAFLVQPGYRLVRLWPDVSHAVLQSAGALPCLTPNWDKRFLALTGPAFADVPVALAAIYLIAGERGTDDAPFVAPVSARQALMELVANGRSADAVDGSLLAHEYRTVGRLRQAVRIRRVVPHESLDRLQPLCDVIIADVRHHICAPAASAPCVAIGSSR